MSKTARIAIATYLFAVLALAGCTAKKEPVPAPATGDSASAPEAGMTKLPAGTVLAAAPEGARSLAEVKSGAQKGDSVTFTARIGGREEPFVADRAVMLVVDPALESCAELHGDACKTPWDYCCEEPDSLLANSATVQFVGEDGKPLPFALEGVDGIEPLRTITVVGTVASKDEGGSLVVTATGIHVAPGS